MEWTSSHSSFAPRKGVNFLRGGGSGSVPAIRNQMGRRSMAGDSRKAHKLLMSCEQEAFSPCRIYPFSRSDCRRWAGVGNSAEHRKVCCGTS
eukprot:768505-Hanusia_phi.AAC.1